MAEGLSAWPKQGGQKKLAANFATVWVIREV